MTRARTPASFSTSTEMVAVLCCIVSLRLPPLPPGEGRGEGLDSGAGADALTPTLSRREREASGRLNQHHPFIGDRRSPARVLRPQDHLVVRRAARDHREAILL